MLMSGEMSDEKPRELYLKEKIDRWMVNEGYRRLYAF
jgi:NADPH oxidase